MVENGEQDQRQLRQRQLFPTTVWTIDLGRLSAHADAWRADIDAKMAAETEAEGRSTRGGWSGPKTLFLDPLYAPLQAECRLAYGAALAAMGLPGDFVFGLEAWANVQDAGGYNKGHIHREALLSGCFYLQMPQGAGAIVFKDPRPGTLYSRPFGRGANSWSEVHLTPKAGALLLFPNWMEHSVEPNASGERRYSIAVNAILPNPKPKNAPNTGA